MNRPVPVMTNFPSKTYFFFFFAQRHAARAIGAEILLSFLASEAKEEFRLTAAGVWVIPEINVHIVREGCM